MGGQSQPNLDYHPTDLTSMLSFQNLDEGLLHMAVHAGLDGRHLSSAGWRAAQEADSGFISAMAKDRPEHDDLAESLGAWFAIRYRADRIGERNVEKVLNQIPNRIAYLDALGLEMYPIDSID